MRSGLRPRCHIRAPTGARAGGGCTGPWWWPFVPGPALPGPRDVRGDSADPKPRSGGGLVLACCSFGGLVEFTCSLTEPPPGLPLALLWVVSCRLETPSRLQCCCLFVSQVFHVFGSWVRDSTLKTFLFPPRFSQQHYMSVADR